MQNQINMQSKFAQALRAFDFQRSLLLTGTPLQNNTQEFWSLLNFLDRDAFASEEKFKEEFGELTKKEQLDALTAQTSRYMLRRMKEDVEKSVPPKEETRVMVELTLLQKKYYRALYEKNLTALCPRGKKASDGPSLMNVAMELRKCCNHPFLLRGIREEVCEQNADKFRNPDAETLAAAGGCLSQARSNLELENLIASSGKLVFLDKLLPKMQKEGHRVILPLAI
jgi:SNF2 family DNA or RNA helicase